MTKRFVMVDDEELTMIPPLKVERPVKVDTPVTSRVDERDRVEID